MADDIILKYLLPAIDRTRWLLTQEHLSDSQRFILEATLERKLQQVERMRI